MKTDIGKIIQWNGTDEFRLFRFLRDKPDKPLYFVTTVCTVLLEMPYLLAAARTVAPFSIM